MGEYRCKFCHRLLCKLTSNNFQETLEIQPNIKIGKEMLVLNAHLEIKCSKCKIVNEFPIISLTKREDWEFVFGSAK